MKYEYEFFKKEPRLIVDVQIELNKRGEEGWRLVAVLDNPGSTEKTFLMERPNAGEK